jgi:hypothetical protein
MPDNGRFSGDIGQAIYATAFANSTFFAPFNSGAASEVGNFIHNNSDYGGSAGNMTQTTIDLVEAMGRNSTDKRYGVEFFIMQLTAGSGTTNPDTFPGGTRYLLCTNGAKAYFGVSGYCTFTAWIRAINGSIGLRAISYNEWEINGVAQSQYNYDLSTSAGWVFVKIVRQSAHGYETGLPFFYANNGNGLQIAVPAIFNGYIKDIVYTAPIASR